ncbi:UNVERIFIED_CONTAM: hypothetical protein Slati_0157100 [Sesamum latifolium]|uniref:Uncharacterized protein n=1 Tax=Sesamum latifolium TaxID=2727402 RepID=A0AAW2YAJ8_9LAMI
MSVYMSRLFPSSNSSFFLCSGLALETKVVHLRDEMYLIDAGVGRPRIATQEELIKPPETAGPARLTNRVGFLNPSNQELPVKNLVLQRCFVDLVTGDSRIKQQAAARSMTWWGRLKLVVEVSSRSSSRGGLGNTGRGWS